MSLEFDREVLTININNVCKIIESYCRCTCIQFKGGNSGTDNQINQPTKMSDRANEFLADVYNFHKAHLKRFLFANLKLLEP